MKEIKNNELTVTFEGRKIFLSSKKAAHQDEFDELAKLVTEQTGHAPKADEAYIFQVQESDNVKILIKERKELLMCELKDDKAKRLMGVCMEVAN